MRQIFLDRSEPRPGCRRSDIIIEGDASLDATFSPGFLLAAEVTLDPRDGDAGPDKSPGEW